MMPDLHQDQIRQSLKELIELKGSFYIMRFLQSSVHMARVGKTVQQNTRKFLRKPVKFN